jgi:hypothetical protein
MCGTIGECFLVTVEQVMITLRSKPGFRRIVVYYKSRKRDLKAKLMNESVRRMVVNCLL